MGNTSTKKSFDVQGAMKENTATSLTNSSASGDTRSDAAKPEELPVQNGKSNSASLPEGDSTNHAIAEPTPLKPTGNIDESDQLNKHKGNMAEEKVIADGEKHGDTVTIEHIEEVVVVVTGPEDSTTMEQIEYSVSEPDGGSKGEGRNNDWGDFEEEAQQMKDSRSNSFHELSTAEAAEFIRQHGEPSGASTSAESDEMFDKVIGSPIVEMQSSVSLVHLGKENLDTSVENKLVSLLHEIQWLGGGESVFIRGSFSNWDNIPMIRMENGTFAHTIPVEKGNLYFYNFVVDDEVRCDEEVEIVKYFVGDEEENVNPLCIQDF